MSKKGISLVILIITIIVLIILTAVVVITGANVPQNTDYAIKMHNQSMVQEAVTLYIMKTMFEEVEEGVKNVEEIVAELYDVDRKQWVVANETTGEKGAVAKLGINLTEEELQAVYVLDENGVVGWVEGQEPIFVVRKVTSIAITSLPTKTTYYAGNTVDMTGLEVIATYSDNTIEDVTNQVIFTPTLEEATKSEGIKNIEVSYQGIKASNGIDLTFILGTLGEQITKDNYYDFVNYEPNGAEQWYIYYKGTVNGQEYIYLISKEKVKSKSWSSYTPDVAEVEKVNNPTVEGYTGDLYNIMKLGQEGYVLDSTRKNSCCVAEMVNGYSEYAATSNPIYGQYVVGAIGGPTIELLTARGNEYYGWEELVLDYTSDADGYKINDTNWWDLDTGILSSGYIWFASPSYNYKEDIIIAREGNIYCNNSGRSYGIHPVVCLKSDVPAIWDGTKWNINIE